MTIALSGINFRDLGGLRARDNATIRPGLFYRSEGPARMIEDHHAELRALGVRTVCDLRSAGEVSAAPHTWCGPECRVLNLEMTTDVRANDGDAWAVIRAEPTAANLARAMTSTYQVMPHALLRHVSVITSALTAGETPLVIHCTAGKDRTGVAVALFLALLGVSNEDIFADYAKSAQFMNNPHMNATVAQTLEDGIGTPPTAEMMRIMMGIDAGYLSTAFTEVERQWGDITGYFGAGGVDSHGQQRVRDALLQ
jgi:protein-tyrosine phosphatase